MNISVSLPTLIPNQLQPQTESARTDNRRAALIPQTRQSEAFNAEPEVGSQKDKSKASQANVPQTSQQTREGPQTSNPQTPVDNRFVEATGEDGQRNKQQQDPKQQEQQQKQELQIKELVDRDQEVRTHEQAHQAAGGQYASSPTYQFSMGPDGKRYATGGEVSIDIGTIPSDPEATIAKMQQVRAAALAPAEPSAQDLSVARSATAKEAQARKAMMTSSSQPGATPADGARTGVLNTYMEQRNQVIAQRYQQAVRPAAQQGLSLSV
ncbi:putative metalloprotease CJM1_0395 family protein [Aeromonas salmonicida]|uniref:putative metalloprotease CJM1_0395 family protein n=1 Tax=Aeromonas salmonicida TaxID=645 RepID=UPI0035A5A545